MRRSDMWYGYMGKILRVDLTTRTWEVGILDRSMITKYLGGRGLGIYMLNRETQAHIDPYDEENVLVFSTGPYTGTGIFSGFYNISTLSPLTGLAASSHSGGTWGPSLKRAGFDALLIRGRAKTPCYLVIRDLSCEILEAKEIWGRGVKETQAFLQARHGGVAVAAIGIAGENLVRYASIMNEIHRAAGRGGTGAVMGSKKLKAIAVGGDQRIEYKDQKSFKKLSHAGAKNALKNGKIFGQYGTSLGLSLLNERGVLPTQNFRAGRFVHAEKISAEAIRSQYWVRDKGCFKCPLRCANVTSVSEGPYRVGETEGPEYESIAALGSNCGNANLASIIKANDMCNDFGMDTISAGNTIAFLFDLHDRGLAGEFPTEGLDLTWGSADTILRLIEQIAIRKGCGDILAEGSMRAARHWGVKCEKYAVHAKGQEFPGFEVRRAQGTGLSFATSSRGACHLRACFYVDELLSANVDPVGLSADKIKLLVEKENFLALIDSFVMCKFGQRYGQFTIDVLSEILEHITGLQLISQDLLQIGERIINTERLYNLSGGEIEDTIPERFFDEDLDDGIHGGAKISREEFDKAVASYYKLRKWSDRGKPISGEPGELSSSKARGG
jgi:aldehyde:ferredoxin oxidoreductase